MKRKTSVILDHDLMDIDKVSKLVDYTEELESRLYDIELDKQFDKSLVIKEILYEIFKDAKALLKRDEENKRFEIEEDIDFKESVENMVKYIQKRMWDEKFTL